MMMMIRNCVADDAAGRDAVTVVTVTESSQVTAETVDQCEMSDNVSKLAAGHRHDDADSSDNAYVSSVAESDCQLSGTVTATAVDVGDSERVSAACVVEQDVSAVCALPAAASGTDSGKQIRLAASSPVIDIEDDAEVVADGRESGTGMKKMAAEARQSQAGSAVKSTVNTAVERALASHGPQSVSPVTSAVSTATVATATTSAAPQNQQSRVACAHPVTSCPRDTAIVPQSGVPTARIIGQIVSIRHRPSPQSAAHKAATARCISAISSSVVPATSTAATRSTSAASSSVMRTSVTSATGAITSTAVASCTSVQSSSVISALSTAARCGGVLRSAVNRAVTRVSATHGPESVSPVSICSEVASTSVVPTSVAASAVPTSLRGRPAVAARGRGVRRGPRRPRRVALLCPDDLYEISSQIVTEMLQRNQPHDADVITCDDDDGNECVVDVDLLDPDVMIVDESDVLAASGLSSAGTQQPSESSAGTRCPRVVPPASSKTAAAKWAGAALQPGLNAVEVPTVASQSTAGTRRCVDPAAGTRRRVDPAAGTGRRVDHAAGSQHSATALASTCRRPRALQPTSSNTGKRKDSVYEITIRLDA